MRVGIFGGTFDPPHVGHLISCLDAADVLGLDRVLWIPANVQPLKRDGRAATAEHRLEMVHRAVAGDRGLEVSSVEIERGGLSFTVDTLADLAQRQPADERFLLLGADAARTLARWREPARVAELAEVVVWQRGDDAVELAELFAASVPRSDGRALKFRTVRARRVDISSTEVRERVRAGLSIRGFVPESVDAYIREAGLYRAVDDREEG